VRYNPPYKNIYKMKIPNEGPMSEWIPLEDGSQARWGYWRGGASPSVKYDCEIDSHIQSVRLALVPGHYVNLWFYKENVGPVDMVIIKQLLQTAEKRGRQPDEPLDELIAIKIANIDTVRKYHDWYLEQKTNAKEY
jgi:hypothetical protein